MNKNLSYRSSHVLNILMEQKKDFFTITDAMIILENKENSTVRKLLSDMTNRGLLMRIKEGLYHRIPYEQKPENYFPDWHLTAEAMIQPREYYIGFYSAMSIHRLITQPSMVEQIVTWEQMKPKRQQVKNVRFEFITFNRDRFFGYNKHWIDDYHKVNCSDLEKTFIDCLYRPGLAGGITEITKAIYKSVNKLNPQKLQEYLEKFDMQGTYKRIGFLLERMGLLVEVQNFVTGKISSSYTPLDPSLPGKGRFISKWKIIDNVDFTAALESLKT